MIERMTDKLLVVMNFIEKNVRKKCLLICVYAIEHCVVIRHLHGVNTPFAWCQYADKMCI